MQYLSLVIRDSREGNHSIERLFNAVEGQFQKRYVCHKIILPHRPSGPLAVLRNMLYVRKHARGIVHVTGDAQYAALLLPGRRTVLTIHDCGYLENLKGIKKILFKWIWFRIPCYMAAQITVISPATKDILEKNLGCLGDKISVVENCMTLGLQPTKKTFNQTKPRILQIGSGPHKNLDTLIRAVKDISCELFIVGKISASNLALLKKCKIAYQNEYAVSDDRLQEIYHQCDILFFASRYEGFGLPILEAQTVGIPVITSNILSMPWVAGEGAVIVDPQNSQQIKQAVLELTNNECLRNSYLLKGYQNLKRFCAEKVADKYAKIYQSLGR